MQMRVQKLLMFVSAPFLWLFATVLSAGQRKVKGKDEDLLQSVRVPAGAEHDRQAIEKSVKRRQRRSRKKNER